MAPLGFAVRRVPRAFVAAILLGAACKSTPAPAPVVTPVASAVPVQRRIGWLLRLEQQRNLRDLGLTPVALDPAAPRAAAFKPATTPALDALALDPDATLRRRALLAIGRIGAPEGVPLLVGGLQDPDAEARASAAFGLGLMGADAKGAIAPLEAALADASPVVRGRAIDALGLIGDASAAPAIVKASAGCGPLLAAVAPDDEQLPKEPVLDLCRLSLLALTRLKVYERLAEVALAADGQPVSRWWPVAYALQRINDKRAAPALLVLASTPGVDTAGFALRGLGALKDPAVLPIATALLKNASADIKVRIAAARALAQLGTAGAVPLADALRGQAVPRNLLIEVVTGIGATGQASMFDVIVDQLTDPSPAMRAAALEAAAKLNPDSFLFVAATLGRDPDWSVRAALATALGTLPVERVAVGLGDLARDEDPRVHGAALEALAAVKAPDLATRLFAALDAPDFAERATAARLLGETKPESGVPRLIAAYARGESDTAHSARAAALEALAKYGGEDAKATIRRGLSDREWPVRWRAAALLREMGETAAMPARPAALRKPAEYFESPGVVHPPYSPHVFMDTRLGQIEVELNVIDAVITSQAVIELARGGFYNGIAIHRLVPTFVIQAGDQRGDGEGGPGFTLPDELSPIPYVRGTVGMALDGRDTGGSQWFITLSPQPHLDAKYTVIGRVVAGWDVLDRLSQGDVIDRIRIWDGVDFK